MGRLVLHWVCVLALAALAVGGCGDETAAAGGSGDGGTAGDGGAGGGGTAGPISCAGPRSTECDDNSACTVDSCGVVDDRQACIFEPMDCGRNDCTEEALCDPAVGCVALALPDGTQCSGGTCEAGQCALNGPVLPCFPQGVRNAVAAGGGPYTFACEGTSGLVLIDEEIVIDKDVILDGEGNLEVRVGGLSIAEGVSAELRGVSVFPHLGISNQGTLTLTNSSVRSSDVGISNSGTLTVTNSAVLRSTVGISNSGTLTVTNSILSHNGGIAISQCHGSSTIANSTLHGRFHWEVHKSCSGSPGSATIVSSLLVNGCSPGEGRPVSAGYNIESPDDYCGFDQSTDQVNVSVEDLRLGELADNGGPTWTHALFPGSVAIDVIPADACEVDEDQRGFPRDSMCDVGAFEVQP